MAKASQETKRELAMTGAALGSVWGGPQKRLYYTPSGDEVWSIPAIREFVQKDEDGKVIAHGERDANLDKGWSFTMPAELKLHCPGCDHWHDTTDEVTACVEQKRASAAAWEKKAQKMNGNSSDGPGGEVAALTVRVEELTGLVEKLLQRGVG